MKRRYFALFVAALIATTASVYAQPCAPCPEDAQCLLPECPTEEPTPDTPQIRVWNRSEQDMETVTVNFSKQEEDYGDIPGGQTTEYRPVELAYGYAYIQFTADGEEYVMQPIDYVGETPLEPGFYTYTLDIVDDTIAFELLQVVATVEYQGGRCINGVCNGLMTLYHNGMFVTVNGLGEQVIHTIDESLVVELVETIEAADYEAIRAVPFTGTCPVAYDGQEVIYTFYNGASAERVASCEYQIDESLPLFTVMTEILATQPTES